MNATNEAPTTARLTAGGARILALPEAMAAASPARLEGLCRIVVEWVVVRDRQVAAIEWTPPARPFFE